MTSALQHTPIPGIRKLMAANRGEIAIRVCRAGTELGLRTVAIYSREDRFALHRFKADESYLIGRDLGPVQAYLDIPGIVQTALDAKVDAIHPGYGFLSENPDFADACRAAGIVFIGPESDTMRRLGSKVEARNLAEEAGVPVMPATGPLPRDGDEIKRLAAQIGYPVMAKASWGGGGRGMRIIHGEDEVLEQLASGRREAKAAFGNDEMFLEKLVVRARHVEVQILGDRHGTIVHLFERDCSLQRRNQKVIERAPAPYLDEAQRRALCAHALRIGHAADYSNAGTVEFLMDYETGEFYFIEVNPRIQVEHTVSEVVTGIDLVKAQIHIAAGARIGDADSGVPAQADIKLNGHALQCRVTTEDPENHFIPDYGRITAYRGATGFGIRLDGGTAYSGAIITPFYDSLLEKVTAWAPTPRETAHRMDRALREFRIRGVKTNLVFLEALIGHEKFLAADYTTRFIDETPELFKFKPRRDRATRLLRFLGEVIVNGNPEVAGRREAGSRVPAVLPRGVAQRGAPGLRKRLDDMGPARFAQWMRHEKRLFITDTTMRDAHQSLLATRFRSHDLARIAPLYAAALPDLFSVECWGGATFDVALRFLKEDPWERLASLRQAMPDTLLQMLLRGPNAVGYANYPDNVVRHFVRQAADCGIDIFRVFDSLNWVENMRVTMDAVLESGKLCEAAICYSGDLSDPEEHKYTLDYYIAMARELEAAGAHILAIKDMAGVCKPAAIRTLVGALKSEIGIPIHFHTHDTSGISAASVLAASDAGIDAVDAAMDSMSGLTSQPSLGAIAEALRGTDRDPGFDRGTLRALATYWEAVRRTYRAFESDLRSGMAEVYEHAMPGGQYTNLREQARGLGIEDHSWPEVARAYAQVNEMFGNIIKVTPTSKVVGDLAIFMVTNDLAPDDVLDPAHDIAFPQSVVDLFKGELGQPLGGFPSDLKAKILKGETPITVRPGSLLDPVDLAQSRADAEGRIHRKLTENELSSYLMYPQIFVDYAAHRREFGDVSVLPTPVFFYGPQIGEEIFIDLEPGKRLILRYLALGEANDKAMRTVFFELNGQPRTIRVLDKSLSADVKIHRKADEAMAGHIAAPMPGLVVSLSVAAGDTVAAGDQILTIEAMKMETTLYTEIAGTIAEIVTGAGDRVEAKDLLVVIEGE